MIKNQLRLIFFISFILISNFLAAQCWFSSLANDLANGTPEFKTFIKTNNEGLESYRQLSGHSELRKDISLLNSTSNFVKNHSDYMKLYPNQFQNIIDNLAKVNVRCKSCTHGSNTGIPTIDVCVENMDWALTKFKNSKVDIQKLFTEMATQGDNAISPWKADGGSYILSVLKIQSDAYLNGIKKFEYKYLADGQFEADIVRELPDGTTLQLDEYKSWVSSTWQNFSNNESAVNQFGAYIKSGNKFEYIVNVSKLHDVENPIKFVKQQFQKVFQDPLKSEVLFKNNPSFFMGREFNGIIIDNYHKLNELSQLDEFWQSDILNFIKLK